MRVALLVRLFALSPALLAVGPASPALASGREPVPAPEGDDYLELQERTRERILKALPRIPEKRQLVFLGAIEVEREAKARIQAAEAGMGQVASARGLVDHAKGKWIGGADRGIAAAKEKLSKAKTPAEEQAARDELAHWEQNRRDGEQALRERQAALDAALEKQPQLERELHAAREGLDAAREQLDEALMRLELLGRLPSTEHLGRLTQDPALTSLRDPARVPVAALEASLRGLAGEDARALLTAAEWVAAGGELQAATQLLAALPEAELTALTEADHARALTLAHSLRRQRGRGALDGALRSRLLQVHEPGAGAAWGAGLVGSHLHALLLGGEITDATAPRPDPDGALATEVLAAFERAGALAGPGSEPSLAELERDRFRFLDRIGRPGPAAAALVTLVDRLGDEQGPLTSEDLREGAKRVAQHLPDAEEGARAARAFGLLERVVRAAAWNDLPAERRLKDLEHWAAYAQGSGAAKTQGAVRAFVGELPALAEEAAYGDEPLPGLDGHPLAALCATRAQHERLLAALTAVSGASETSATPESEESVTEPAPDAVPPGPVPVDDPVPGDGDPPPAPEA
jgi:hypothetical protein